MPQCFIKQLSSVTSSLSEVIGALLSVFTIWVITGVLIYLAILRIINQDYELDANPMLITASLGVVINIV